MPQEEPRAHEDTREVLERGRGASPTLRARCRAPNPGQGRGSCVCVCFKSSSHTGSGQQLPQCRPRQRQPRRRCCAAPRRVGFWNHFFARFCAQAMPLSVASPQILAAPGERERERALLGSKVHDGDVQGATRSQASRTLWARPAPKVIEEWRTCICICIPARACMERG